MTIEEKFKIEKINRLPDGLTWADVHFTFSDTLDGGREVFQNAIFTIRITTKADLTITELNEALFEKAKEVLSLTNSVVQNTTAHKLFSH